MDAPDSRLRLAPGYRLIPDKQQLAGPAGAMPVNELGYAVLGLCTGQFDLAAIQRQLGTRGKRMEDLTEFVFALRAHGWVVGGSAPADS
jgi:hypothetical protein